MNNIAIFASGTGSNAENITRYFLEHSDIRVRLIVSNRAESPVLAKAEKLGVEALHLTKNDFSNGRIIDILTDRKINFIVLAGFMMLVPTALTTLFENRILNIHPALLPKFGGKGMFGDNVHRAVVESGERQTGITIHLIDEQYDNGAIVFQKECDISPGEPADEVAEKVHALEYLYYPRVIEAYIQKTKIQF